jgi:hypothetical protein
LSFLYILVFNPLQMYSWERLSPILCAAPSIWWHFFSCAEAFEFHVVPFCQSFFLVAELLEFYLGSHCLCLLIPKYSISFHALASNFQVLC